MLNLFIYILLSISIIYCLYFVVMASGILKKKKKIEIKEDKNNFFGIIIAARNEEEVIGNLIKSLNKQNYPKDCFEIFVVVNNCTDNTAGVAKKEGATVIECKEKVKSKGDVLKYTFNKLKDNNKIDAYVIFDADNIVHSDFLNKMNESINMGYSVAQGFRDTKNISDNWLTSSYAILYYIQSLFINESRYKMGKSSFLNGTGFMVRKEVIDKHGFDPKTLTEDIEFTALCAINDEKIAFNIDAITYDEQVIDLKSSLTQRKRWSYGTVECLKEYFSTLIKKGIKERNFECIDVAIYYLSVSFTVILTFVSIILFLLNFFAFSGDSINYIFNSGLLFVSMYLIGILFRIYLIKKCNKRIMDNLGGILLFDLFVFTWVPINFICLFIKKCDWEAIKHNRNIEINESK